MRQCILGLIFLLLLTGSSNANTEVDRLYHYPDTFEVSATQLPQPISNTGRRIQVIDGGTFNDLPVSSVDELLRYVPGVEVQMRNGFGVQSDFSIRGSTFNQVMVLIDGMPLNDPLTGHFSSYIPISPDEISRIEVLHGPSAAIYGPNAVGGTINIVTKTFDAGNRHQKTSAGLSYDRGEHKLNSSRGGFYNESGNWRYGAGFLSNISEGHPIDQNRNADFNINTISGSAGRSLGDKWYMSARASYDYRDFSAVNFYTTIPVDSSRETVSHFWTQTLLQRKGENSRTSFNATFRQTEDLFVFQQQAPANEHTTNRGIFRADHLYRVSERFSVQGGFQTDFRSIESTDRGTHEDLNAGIFLSSAYAPVEPLTLTLSARADYDENFGLETSPQVSASYNIGQLTLRGLAGRSIRSADYTERYNSYGHPELHPGRNLGNPALEAESAWNYEVGADYRFSQWLQTSVTGFMRDGRNLIDWAQVQGSEIDIDGGPVLVDDANYFFARNLRSLQTYGTEFSISGNGGSDQYRVSYEAGYTYLQSSAPEDGIVTKYIAGHANHLLQTAFTFTAGSLSLGLNGFYKERDAESAEAIGANTSPEYWLVNGRIGWQIDPFPLRVNLRVNNITDNAYSDLLGAQMPGRWVMAGLQYAY